MKSVVGRSVDNEDVLVLIEVVYESDADHDDSSTDDAVLIDVFNRLFVVVEISRLVDKSSKLDEMPSARAVDLDISDETYCVDSSLFILVGCENISVAVAREVKIVVSLLSIDDNSADVDCPNEE